MLPVDTINNYICPLDIELGSIVGMVDMKQFQLTEQVSFTVLKRGCSVPGKHHVLWNAALRDLTMSAPIA